MTEAQGPSTGQVPTYVSITSADLVQLLGQVRSTNIERHSNPKVEDPELYQGERHKLRAFLTQCELKFNCENNKFDTDTKKINYASARCRGNAWSWIEPSIVDGRSTYETWALFKTAITRAFGEADAKEVARRKFRQCRQGARSAAAYWAEFQRIISDLDYNAATYIDQFNDGLHLDVQRQLALLEERPTAMTDYANRAIALDNRLYNFRTLRTRNEPQYYQQHPSPKPEAQLPDPDPMELDATRRYKSNQYQPGGYRPRPRGNCYNCGKPGHFQQDCKTPRNPTRNTTWRKPYRAAEASYEDEEEQYEPSGKEHPRE